jgi:prepilin-type N-terminal cleavage/methylation domain-containing protein
MSSGYTLFEVVTALTIASILVVVGVTRVSGLGDRAAVNSFRYAVVGVFSEARMRAVTQGGAVVRITEMPPSVRLLVGDSVVRRIAPDAVPSGVTIQLAGSRSEASFEYDLLGIGRMAGGTIYFRRRSVERALVVSSFGRVTSR